MVMINLKESIYVYWTIKFKKRFGFLTEDKSDAERRGKTEHTRKNANSYTGRISGGNLKKLWVGSRTITSIHPTHLVICGDYCSRSYGSC